MFVFFVGFLGGFFGGFFRAIFWKTFPGRVRVKFAQNEDHEKATKNAQTLFFQADEGHGKATKK